MKTFFKNRHGLNVCVAVDEQKDAKGVVFVMHGLGGFKEQMHIVAFAQAFIDSGMTVVRFDATHSLGESDGTCENMTVTSNVEDLEDVILGSATQPWYRKPFWLVGHSLGSLCVTVYAERHPNAVRGLAPISSMISGKLSVSVEQPEVIASWKRTGWNEMPSGSRPGVVKRVKWAYVEDSMRYDILADADRLTMPLFLCVGDGDKGTPLHHQRLLYDAAKGPKELHVIKGAQHTFRDAKHLAEISGLLKAWIGKYV